MFRQGSKVKVRLGYVRLNYLKLDEIRRNPIRLGYLVQLSGGGWAQPPLSDKRGEQVGPVGPKADLHGLDGRHNIYPRTRKPGPDILGLTYNT